MNNKTIIDKNSLQIKKNTKRKQVFTFRVLNPVTLMLDTITVETNFLDDFDNFGITVTHDSWLPENEGEIMYGVFDSDGGTYNDFEVYVNLEEDNNEEYVKVVEDFVLVVLYGDNGLISKYTYEIDENGKLVE
jgi:hypothetical protein|nr:MAG TPA: hypothetical protein [Caudoviricetes sp.]